MFNPQPASFAGNQRSLIQPTPSNCPPLRGDAAMRPEVMPVPVNVPTKPRVEGSTFMDHVPAGAPLHTAVPVATMLSPSCDLWAPLYSQGGVPESLPLASEIVVP